MFTDSRPRRLFVKVTVAALAAAVSVVLSAAGSAQASPGDQIAPVTDSGARYSQSFARNDATVAATYTLAGARITQDSTSTAAMNSRGTSVVFSPTGVLSSTGALIDNNAPTTCLGGNGTASDCGTNGTITIAFDHPVTNPTLHFSGLGGGQTVNAAANLYANFASYFDLTASASSTAAANSATFSGLQGTPTNLQLTSGGRVQTTGIRPSTSCDNTSTAGSTSTAGCGSVGVAGVNLTSITLTVGLRNSGAAVDLNLGTATDAFLLDVSIPQVAGPGTAFTCLSNAIYAVDGTDYNINKVDTGTGAETFIGHVNAASGTNLNGLAIADGGGAAYTINRNVSPGGSTTIYRLDPLTGATTTYAGPTLTQTTTGNAVTHGAINPANGIYYFGIIGGDGLEIYGFNTNTNTAITGRIAHVPSITGGNGDLAFDRIGRLVFVASSGNNTATANPLLYVNAPLPATGNDATLTTSTVGYMQPNNSTFNGLAFDLPTGYLYVNSSTSGQSTLRQLNPTSGTEIANHGITYLGQATNDVTDLASCSYNNSIQLQKNIVTRANAGDQFTVAISGGGLSTAQSGTTSGASTGVQSSAAATAGAFPALAGAQYTITETAGNAGTNLSKYITTWKCVSLLDTSTTLASGTGTTGTVTFPTPTTADGIPLACYFTNEAIASAITIAKTADQTAYHVGDTVTYTIKVTNSGNSTLTGVAVTDPTDTRCARTVGTLAAGASSTYTCTDTAPVTGNANTASVSGTDPLNAQVTASSTATVTTIRPSLTLTKSASPTTVTAAGQTVTYTFAVTNNGDATVSSLSIADSPVTPGGVPASISCAATTLAAGASTNCTGTYTVTQADVDNGTIKDNAVANGKDQLGSTVISNTSTATVSVTQTSSLALTKSATPTTISTVGAAVSYAFVVRNSGNTTITNLSIADVFDNASVTPPTISCPSTTLAPGASVRCTATYSSTQSDLDQGSINNTASASGKNPAGTTVTSNSSSAAVTATAGPAITLVKSASPTTVTAAGQTVTYSFLATNTGNQTLTNLAIADTFTAPAGPVPTITCPTRTLAPGASTTCTATYSVTVADMNKGSIKNSAVAQSTSPNGTAVNSAQSNVTVTATQRPALTVVKTASPTNVTTAGQQITYSFAVRNTGNVTVDNIAVTDTLAAPATPELTVSCPVTSLAPNGTTTCTGTYTTRQADLDNGSVRNSATVAGTDPTGAAVTSPASSATVTVTRTSTLTLTKSASPTSVNTVNQAVTYSFLVTNTGNQTLTGLTVGDTFVSPAGPPLTISCPATTLAPNANTTCTATYRTLQADLDKGTINNSASATAKDPTNTTATSNTSSATVTATQTASLSLAKTASPTTVTAVGQTVNYSFRITNTGNTTVSGIAVADPMFTGSAAASCPVTSLGSGASTTCTASYTTTQADLDNGSIRNTARATGTDPQGNAVTSATSTATVAVTQTATLALTKSATPASVQTAGTAITYSFAVQNTGNVTITTLAISDTLAAPAGPQLSQITCPSGSLAPNATATCTATYTATQDDINNGSINNSARATGRNPAGTTVTSNTSTATVSASKNSKLSLTKSATPTTVTTLGTRVTYRFAVTNSGNTTINGIAISDTFTAPAGPALAPITCPVTTLAPGDSTTCTADYTVTQADLDNGAIRNSATASGTDTSGTTITSNTSNATVTATRTATLTVTDSPSRTTVTAAGQTVDYRFLVTNTGNVTVSTPAVTDSLVSPAAPEFTPNCPSGSLAPGASIICTATYTVTQADIDNGSVKNSAVATGKDPAGNSISSPRAAATVTATQSPGMTVVKSASPTTVAGAGTQINYSFTVTNTGNVTLSLLHVTDTLTAPASPTPTVSCPSTTVAPAAVIVCTASYTVTQTDMDSGSIGNSAVAQANDPQGNPISSPSSGTSVTATRTATLSLVKSASPTSVSAAGQSVTYTFTVRNTGSVTISNVAIADTFTAPAGPALAPITCTATTLAPDATTTCTASYTTKQADVDKGSIDNTATASGTDPAGTAVASNQSVASVTASPAPSLSLTKTASPTTVAAVGQTVTYTFAVKNTGNVGVNTVSVTDPLLATAPNCPATTLAPNATTNCTGTYTVTQADLDRGSISNTATASGRSPAGATVTSPQATATVTATQSPALTVTNNASRATVTAAGQTVTYTFGVTNSGTVTVHGVNIVDRFTAPAGPPLSPITCGATTLAPNATTTCTATYTVTQADIDNGSIVNTATAAGLDPNNSAVGSAPRSVTVTATPSPALTVVKSANPTSATRSGQTVTYSFAVTNTGNVTISNLSIADTFTAPAGPPLATNCPATTLAPNASTNCTGTYTITQADVDAGSVANSARATGRSPAGATVNSAASTATVTIAPGPALSLTQTVAPRSYDSAGDSLTYTLTVTNTGTVTLSGVAITDPLFTGANAPVCSPTSIAPGASSTCTATYTITQADVDNGSVVSQGSASANTPGGAVVTSPPATAAATATQTALLRLTKSASPQNVDTVGQLVTYRFAVTNAGNVTLQNLTVTDVFTAPASSSATVTCPDTTLAPGASTACAASYASTQADFDQGSIANTATAHAVGTGSRAGVTTDSNASSATVTTVQSPALTMTKSASPTSVSRVGQTVTYTFQVRNTGTVTVHDLSIADTLSAPAGPEVNPTCTTDTLDAGDSTTCQAGYSVTQADLDNGSINNSAVAQALDNADAPVASPASTATVTADQASALTMTEAANPTTVTTVGQTVTYSFTVTNTGTVTARNVHVDDPLLTGSGAPTCSGSVGTTGPSLAPGASVACTGTYVTTQADFDRGTITDTAVANATNPAGGPVSSDPTSAPVTPTQTQGISVAKTATAAQTVDRVGRTVSYSLVATNTGNTTLTNVAISDTLAAPAGPALALNCQSSTTVAPNGTYTCTATYTATQADLDNGSINNSAGASGRTPSGTTVTAAPSTASVPTQQAPALSLDKSVSPTTAAVGDRVTYSFLVTNNGTATISGIAIRDTFTAPATPVPTITCPSTTLAPGASTTCTGSYQIKQADGDAGSVVNTATATGTAPGNRPVTSNQSSARVDIARNASLTVLQQASPTAVTAVGQTVSYTFKVTNNGNVTVQNVAIADTFTAPAGPVPTITCPSTTLAPGASTTCTGTYTVTQADLDHGSIDSSATATGKGPGNATVTSGPSTASVTATPSSGLSLVEMSSPRTVTAAGQTITYTFTVKNNGAVTVHGLSIADSFTAPAGPMSAIVCTTDTLAPDDSTTCQGTYVTTQDDVDLGTIRNSAVAQGLDPQNDTVESNASAAVVTAAQSPALRLTKAADPTSVDAAGDTVDYTFTIENTGNVTLQDLSINDTFSAPAAPALDVTCPTTPLAPQDETDCTATYTATQADLDHGSIDNSAVAGADSPTGPVRSAASTASVTAVQSQELTLEQTVDPTSATAAGQTVTYSFHVTNSGNVTVSGLTIADTLTSPAGPALTISCPTATLAPDADTTCTATYQVTQSDVDRGRIDNLATATGRDPGDDPVASDDTTTTVAIDRVNRLSLVKSSSVNTVTTVGRAVTYSFLVTNTGNTTIRNLTVTDVFTAPAGPALTVSCPQTSLLPGTSTTCTANYTVSRADVDNGSITNTAAAHGTAPDNSTVNSPTSTATISVTQQAAMNVSISAAVGDADHDGKTDLGDVITWTITVTNPGNVTLRNVDVSDRSAYTVTCPSTTVLAGTSMECTATHTITQADVDTGHVDNSASASGTDPNGRTLDAGPVDVSTPIDVTNSLAIVQTASATTLATVGQQVTYTFTVTNTGNTTLTGVALTDVLASPAGPALTPDCPSTTTLAPGAHLTCTADYTSTQDDFDNGSVSNSASATASSPAGTTVAAGPSVTTVATTQTAALGLVKHASVSDLNGNGYADLGDTVRWTFVVTNTGTVTLDRIAVHDAKAGAVTCPRATLVAGGTETCTAVALHTISQADVDAGTVDNTATVTARSPHTGGTTVTSAPSSTSTPIGARPGLVLVKTGALVDVNDDGVANPGDRILWSFLVTDTGNVTMSTVHVTDPRGGTVTCRATSLAPGLSTTCRADRAHTVTQADVDHGSVSNTATAIGTPPGGRPLDSPASTATVPLTARGALTLVKTAQVTDSDGDGANDAGDTVTWLFRVTNTGNVTISGVRIVDPGAGPIGCSRTTLAPGASMTCTSQARAITERQASRPRLTNTATATGSEPSGGTITSPPSSATVTIDAQSGSLGGSDGSGSGNGNGNGTANSNGAGTVAYTGARSLPLLVWFGVSALLVGLLIMLVGAGPRRRRVAAYAPRHRSEGNGS